MASMHRAARATLFAASLALAAAGAQAQTGTDGQMQAGIDLYKTGNYESALLEFEGALLADPTGFTVLYYLGLTLYKLERWTEAGQRLEAFLAKGGASISDVTAKEVDKLLASVAMLTGEIVVSSSVPGATVYVDGMTAPSGTAVVNKGEHQVEVRASGHQAFLQTVEVKGGDTVTVEAVLLAHGVTPVVEPEPEPPPPPPLPPPLSSKKIPPAAFWSAVGLTGALFVATTVTGSLALVKNSEYAKLDASDDWKPLRSSLVDLAVATDVLLGATIALAAATVVMIFFTELDPEKDDPETTLSFSPLLFSPGIALFLSYH